MMIDFIYYCIYHSSSKKYENVEYNPIPALVGILVGILAVFMPFFVHFASITGLVWFLIMEILIAIISHRIFWRYFIKSKRYIDIIQRYEKLSQNRGFSFLLHFITFLLVILPFCLVFFTLHLFTKLYL